MLYLQVSNLRLVLKLFRGEPAISGFDWNFSATHSSSAAFSTEVGSVLHGILLPLHNAGITVGFNIFDGNRRREKRNASLAFKNRRLERQDLELALRSDLSNLWQAYRNNLQLLNLERQNLITAKDNHDIAMDRYIQGDLSGFEVREAQKSLLDAEERILSAEYNTKLCEISLLQISGKITKYLE